MAATDIVQVEFNEDGSATALGRVTARDASGAFTGVSGEGKFIQQTDLATITCAIFDESGSTPNVADSTPTVTISVSIIDVPVTDNEIWIIDAIGYNFLFDFPIVSFSEGGHIYRVEFKYTTNGGTVSWGKFRGPAKGVRTS